MGVRAMVPKVTVGLGLTAMLMAAAMVMPVAAVAVDDPPPALAHLDDCRLPSAQSAYHEGFPIEASSLPSSGLAQVTSIYADFTDAPGDPAAIDGIEALLERGSDVLETQSGGRLDLERQSHVEWVRLPKPAVEYEFGFGALLRDAVATVDPLVDFSGTDVLWLIIPPGTSFDRSQERHPESIPSTEGVLTRAVLLSQPSMVDFQEWVVVHESGHSLGLPDLYEDPVDEGEFQYPYTGGWDPMGHALGPGREFFGWHLWRLGWIEDSAVSCIAPGTVGAIAIDSLGLRGSSTIAVVRLSEFEALVVESRRPDGYDEKSSSGALVYRVDASIATGQGPVRVVVPDGSPAFTSISESTTAVMIPGDRYTDPMGVVVEALSSPDPEHEDIVRIDTRALGPEPSPAPVVPSAEGGSSGQPAATTPRLPNMGPEGADRTTIAVAVLLLLGTLLIVSGHVADARRRRSRHR